MTTRKTMQCDYMKGVIVMCFHPNVDPLKPKVMKLTYTWKVTFNINGTTIHFTIAIPLNKNQS
jgi:hypothetical protein